MKRIVLLLSFVAMVALCANAQSIIDFHQMPIANSPSPMPDSYPVELGLYWDDFYYVTPGLWTGEGPGFWVDPATRHNTVAFIGGPTCSLSTPCHGSIKLQVVPNATATFTPITMSLAAGWATNNVIVTAYNKSEIVGRVIWRLTTTPKVYSFPATWNRVTQLVFIPEVPSNIRMAPRTTPSHAQEAGSMVVYTFVLMKH